jgi:hypothetical protein
VVEAAVVEGVVAEAFAFVVFVLEPVLPQAARTRTRTPIPPEPMMHLRTGDPLCD